MSEKTTEEPTHFRAGSVRQPTNIDELRKFELISEKDTVKIEDLKQLAIRSIKNCKEIGGLGMRIKYIKGSFGKPNAVSKYVDRKCGEDGIYCDGCKRTIKVFNLKPEDVK